jgi:TRIAD3 protein (E3 ubiquitin-protein ligase RNF216)
MENRCLAITKQHKPCKNNKKHPHKLFCATHTKSTPEIVILDGGELFQKTINYTTEAAYFTALETYKTKLEDANARIEAARIEEEKQIEEFKNCNTCQICFTDIDNRDDLIQCSNTNHKFKHFTCETCLCEYIKSHITDGIASYDCMFNSSDKCNGVYNDLDIRRAISHHDNPCELYAKWSETTLLSNIMKMANICENYLICPLCCHWGCIFDIPPGADKQAFFIKCESCTKSWCNLCKRIAHPGVSCYSIQFKPEENLETRTEFICKMLQDIVSRVLTHSCSTCGSVYIKDEGCNLMTCPKCGALSCYICNTGLYVKNNTKYWHFTGHHLADPTAGCPLWNNHAGDGKENQGNTEYNLRKIKAEIIAFKRENVRNLGTVELIEQCIRKLWDKDRDFKILVQEFAPTGPNAKYIKNRAELLS